MRKAILWNPAVCTVSFCLYLNTLIEELLNILHIISVRFCILEMVIIKLKTQKQTRVSLCVWLFHARVMLSVALELVSFLKCYAIMFFFFVLHLLLTLYFFNFYLKCKGYTSNSSPLNQNIRIFDSIRRIIYDLDASILLF